MAFDDAIMHLKRAIDTHQQEALSRIQKACAAGGDKVWARQQAEAAAWLEDNTTRVPMMQKLAHKGGVTVAEVVMKVSKRAVAANSLISRVNEDAQWADKKLRTLRLQAEKGQLPDNWPEQLEIISTQWRKNWPPELV